MVEFEKIVCSRCDREFGLEAEKHRALRESGATFYCPNGCKMSYHETLVGRLKQEVAELQRTLAWVREERDRYIGDLVRSERRRAAFQAWATRRHRELDRLREGA